MTSPPSRPRGSRLYEDAARWTARQGYVLHTGAAPGADQRAAEAALAEGGRVHLFLPWGRFEWEWRLSLKCFIETTAYVETQHPEWAQSVYDHHPVYQRGRKLERGPFALHARNAGIVLGTSAVIALPSTKPGGGGTGQGMRLARAWGIPLYDLTQEDGRRSLERLIGESE